MTAAEASFVGLYIIFGDGNVAYVLYLGVGAGIVTPKVLGRNLMLDSLICRTRLWFIVALACISIVWVFKIDVGMLGLVYLGVGAGTVVPGVLNRYTGCPP